jgi:hypothetical protein
MYFLGIDWSDLHHDVALLDEKGQELSCHSGTCDDIPANCPFAGEYDEIRCEANLQPRLKPGDFGGRT